MLGCNLSEQNNSSKYLVQVDILGRDLYCNQAVN